MKNLYIITFFTGDNDDVEWCWAYSEDEALQYFYRHIEEMGWDGIEHDEVYEITIPNDVQYEVFKHYRNKVLKEDYMLEKIEGEDAPVEDEGGHYSYH